ncbi:7317_t:CDS:2 [Funneliformis geosporum]|uniref:7317_t:CDS:1 n=1 Tax=Funneliformis geosporum TaxID=1117311 RepID=A0A9W4SW63_9GLOM|nr:7317_t:CDS:2 [Funneliformis geosporum]
MKKSKKSNGNDIHYSTRERLIPTSDAKVTLGHDVELRKALIPLIVDMIPGWNDVSHESHIQIERVSGALTNCVFFITKKLQPLKKVENEKPPKIVLRIYGIGVDLFIDRQKELRFLQMLSSVNIGPQLLGIFKNGRFEQYLESTTLTNCELRTQSCRIAQRMFQLHYIVRLFPPPRDTIPEVWANIDKWYPFALNTIFSKAYMCTEKQKRELKEFDFDLLKHEIEHLKVMLFKLDSPIVFAHNDTQYGNILRLLDGTDQLVVVDFEYSGYNYRGFDIGNHWCEWMFDYHSSEPHKVNLDWYPTEEEQIKFLQAYILAEQKLISSEERLIYSPSLSSSNNSDYLQKLRLEANAFALASHVMWGLWGLVQSGQSNINFDYLSYGMSRLKTFRDLSSKIYDKINLL